MALRADYLVRPARPGDSDQISSLITNGSFVHRHLDWRTPLEWISFPPYFVIEQNERIITVLACPPDPPSIAWIRVFATSGEFSASKAWNMIWSSVLHVIQDMGGKKVAVIVLEDWFQDILEQNNFSNSQDIVMLTWLGDNVSELKTPDRFQIRNMVEQDIPGVAEVDALAFDPLWHNSSFALQKAFRQAALATVVEDRGVIVGYQLTTKNLLGAHLARLAVHPGLQGKGIGNSLVTDMIQRLNRIGVTTISVNTQSDNLVSLSLYKRVGFKVTGERYPVYSYEVN